MPDATHPTTTMPDTRTAPPTLSPEDEHAVRAVIAAYEDAWNRHDPAALGTLLADDAQWVNIVGMYWRGRAAVAEAHAAFHAEMFRDTPMRVEHASVRALAPGVATAVLTIAMGDFTAPDGRLYRGTRDRMTLVLVRRAGAWLVGHGHNVVIDPVAAPFDPVSSRGETGRA